MKPAAAIDSWLRKKRSAWFALHIGGALGVLAFGLLVLFATFWIVYLIIWVGFSQVLPHSETTRTLISLGVLALLFAASFAVDESFLTDVPVATKDKHGNRVEIMVPARGGMGEQETEVLIRRILWFMTSGPRVVRRAFSLFGRAFRLRALDTTACAAVLAYLLSKDSRVPLTELVPVIREGHDPKSVMRDLCELDGVLMLITPPPGLSLMSEFREELAGMCRAAKSE